MKKLFLLTFVVFACCIKVDAQDTRLVGTWKYHRDEIGGNASWDYYIRIDIENGNVYVRLKLVGNNVDGRDFQTRTEGEHVRVNADGSISFDDYLSKKEYDNDDHLYWTVWNHYVVRYEGGRLLSSQTLMGEAYNRSGYLVKEDKNRGTTQKIYYNEKDNW